MVDIVCGRVLKGFKNKMNIIISEMKDILVSHTLYLRKGSRYVDRILVVIKKSIKCRLKVSVGRLLICKVKGVQKRYKFLLIFSRGGLLLTVYLFKEFQGFLWIEISLSFLRA